MGVGNFRRMKDFLQPQNMSVPVAEDDRMLGLSVSYEAGDSRPFITIFPSALAAQDDGLALAEALRKYLPVRARKADKLPPISLRHTRREFGTIEHLGMEGLATLHVKSYHGPRAAQRMMPKIEGSYRNLHDAIRELVTGVPAYRKSVGGTGRRIFRKPAAGDCRPVQTAPGELAKAEASPLLPQAIIARMTTDLDALRSHVEAASTLEARLRADFAILAAGGAGQGLEPEPVSRVLPLLRMPPLVAPSLPQRAPVQASFDDMLPGMGMGVAPSQDVSVHEQDEVLAYAAFHQGWFTNGQCRLAMLRQHPAFFPNGKRQAASDKAKVTTALTRMTAKGFLEFKSEPGQGRLYRITAAGKAHPATARRVLFS